MTDNLASIGGMLLMTLISWTLKNRQDDEKRERERADKRIEALEKAIVDRCEALDAKLEAQGAKVIVYREEQIRHETRLENIESKIDRALDMLESLSGIEKPANRGKSRP